MSTVALVANVPLDIEGKHYEPGEPLTVSATRYGYLLVVGKARLSSSPQPPPKPARRGPPRGARGQYRRRDMRADD